MRKILDELYNIIDARLNSVNEKDPRALLILAAQCLSDVREVGGNNQGKMVEMIQKTVDGQASREAWCMAFVQTCIAYVERKLQVKSPLLATEHCMTLWRATPDDLKVKYVPKAGAIVIWKHGSSDSGHTGIVKTYIPGLYMNLVEGNTEAGDVGGKVVREGGGVYPTKRKIGQIGNMQLVGFIIPFKGV